MLFRTVGHISYAQCTCPLHVIATTPCCAVSPIQFHACIVAMLASSLTNRAGAHSLPLLVNRDEKMQPLPPFPPSAVSDHQIPAFLHFFPERGIQCKHHIDFTSYRPSVAQLHYNPQNLGVNLGKYRNYDVADLRC